MPILVILILLMMSGCSKQSDYEIVSANFETRNDAAVAFYKNNMPVIESLNDEQELLGYVIQCGERYYHTNWRIGGVKNKMSLDVAQGTGCSTKAIVHTHPVSKGIYLDFFSRDDMKTGELIPTYLFSLHKNVVRVTDEANSKFAGRVITII